MFYAELDCACALVLVHVQSINRSNTRGKRIGRAEQHSVEKPPFAPELRLEVALADDSLTQHFEIIVEARLRESRAPDLVAQEQAGVHADIAGMQRSICFDAPLQVGSRQPRSRGRFKSGGEALEMLRTQSDARRRGMAAEAAQQIRF